MNTTMKILNAAKFWPCYKDLGVCNKGNSCAHKCQSIASKLAIFPEAELYTVDSGHRPLPSRADKTGFELLYGRKKRKSIKANGQSNLIFLANWVESRVVLPR